MPTASIKKEIPCSKDNLIKLVLDIEKYPEFVPWCLNGKIHTKVDKGELVEITADLTIGKKWFFKEKCKNSVVDFHVDFELKNKILNILMIKSFDIGLKKIANAFEKRANDLFSNTSD